MAAQVQTLPTLSVNDISERRRIVDSALGTTLAEGVSPGPEVMALAERYVTGELSMQQLGTAVRAKYGLK